MESLFWTPINTTPTPEKQKSQPPWPQLQINISRKIGKVSRLHIRIEPFPALFWAIGIVLAHILQQVTQHAGLASLHCGTGTVLYSRGQLGSIRVKTSRLPAFTFLAVLILCHTVYSSMLRKKCQIVKQDGVLSLVSRTTAP